MVCSKRKKHVLDVVMHNSASMKEVNGRQQTAEPLSTTLFFDCDWHVCREVWPRTLHQPLACKNKERGTHIEIIAYEGLMTKEWNVMTDGCSSPSSISMTLSSFHLETYTYELHSGNARARKGRPDNLQRLDSRRVFG